MSKADKDYVVCDCGHVGLFPCGSFYCSVTSKLAHKGRTKCPDWVPGPIRIFTMKDLRRGVNFFNYDEDEVIQKKPIIVKMNKAEVDFKPSSPRRTTRARKNSKNQMSMF